MYFNLKKGTLLLSLVFLIVVIVGFIKVQTFPSPTSKTLGPGYMPKVLMSGLSLFALYHIAQSINPKFKDTKVYIGDIKLQIATLLSIVIYLILIKFLGFYVSTTIWLFGIFSIFLEKKYVQSLIYTILLLGIVYGLFGKLLQVNFPRSIFW